LLEMHAIARQIFMENLKGDLGAGARDYLKARGIRADTWETFGVGVSDASWTQLVDRLRHYGPDYMRASGLFKESHGKFQDRFVDRLMFPIESAHGETIAFTGRKSEHDKTDQAKYKNSPHTEIYTKGDELYNFGRARDEINRTGQVVLVEGQFDTMAAHQAGVKNVVGASGTALSETQVGVLAKNARTAILNLDADSPGRDAAERHSQALVAAGLEVRSAVTPHDAASYLKSHTKKEYREEIRDAQPLVVYLAERAKEKYDLKTFEGKLGATQWLADSLEGVAPEQRAAVSGQLHQYLNTPKLESEERAAGKQPVRHRAAWDMTFSADKTVSLTGLAGGDHRIIALHEKAVKEALEYGEKWIQVKMGGLHNPESTGRMVSALFLHDTARPVDGYAAPQIHTHAVIFNMSQDAAGQVRALDPRELFRLQGALEAVYQNHLAVGLKRLGYEVEIGPSGAAEVAGYSKAYREAESPRREAIEEERARLQQFGPEADRNIARNTRNAKLDHSPAEIKAAHLERAAKFGNEPQAVVEAARGRTVEPDSAKATERVADDAVKWAAGRLSERTTVMEDHELARDALKFGRTVIMLPDFEAAFKRAKEKDFVEVKHWREYAPQQRWTTPELIAKEKYILDFMAQGRGQYRAIDRGVTRDEFKDRYKEKFDANGKKVKEGLNNDQTWKLWHVVHNADRMSGLGGIAGAGKTKVLAVVKEFAERYGYEVHGLAATNKAVNELQTVGINSSSIAKFMLEKQEPKGPRMYFMDESSLVDVHQAAGLLKKLNAGDRVVAIGDDKQHASLGAGRVFKELQDAGMATWYLKENVRQRQEDYRDVVKKLSKGEIVEALVALDQQGRIRAEPDQRFRYAAIAEEYVNSPEGTLVVSPDNRSRIEIGGAIRDALREVGKLGQDVYSGRILQARADFHKNDVVLASSYRVGDVIAYARAAPKLGIRAGDYASVLDVATKKNEITVMRESDGQLIKYNPGASATTASVYEPAQRQFAVGDRIQMTKSLKSEKIANRSHGGIEKLDAAGNAVLRMDRENQKVLVNLEKMPHIDHGYVATSYSSQSVSVGNVIVHLDTDSPAQVLLNRAFAYVAVSRGRDDVKLFTNDREDLNRVLLRTDEKPMALPAEQVQAYRAAQGKGAKVVV
jgi:DNA primase catalytic core